MTLVDNESLDESLNHEDLEEIIKFCGSFLTIRNHTVYLVHQSAKDFLLSKAMHNIFPLGVGDQHYAIYSQSIKKLSECLQRNIYGLDPGTLLDEVVKPVSDPLVAVRYSCIYWVDHLKDSLSSGCQASQEGLRDGGSLDTFLRRKHLYRLEALALLESVPNGILTLVQLEKQLQVSQLPGTIHLFSAAFFMVERHLSTRSGAFG